MSPPGTTDASATDPPPSGDRQPAVVVERQRVLDDATARRLRRIYLDAFEPMRTRSAMRVVMTDDEWRELVLDNDDAVNLVGTVDGEVVGAMVLTNRPDRIDWLEPAFLQHRFPEALAEGRLWYIITVCASAEGSRAGVFKPILDAMIDLFDGGVLLYDTCEANTRLTSAFGKSLVARGIDPGPLATPLDVETFYCMRLDGSVP